MCGGNFLSAGLSKQGGKPLDVLSLKHVLDDQAAVEPSGGFKVAHGAAGTVAVLVGGPVAWIAAGVVGGASLGWDYDKATKIADIQL